MDGQVRRVTWEINDELISSSLTESLSYVFEEAGIATVDLKCYDADDNRVGFSRLLVSLDA